MAIDLEAQDREGLRELRHQSVLKRVRARRGDVTVLDSTHAVLVWEPRRVVPSYAVPEGDVLATLLPAQGAPPSDDGRPLLDPRVPFGVHTTPGEALAVRLPDATVVDGAAYRLAELPGLVVLDFDAFDWLDEDQPLVSHPRDPRHRIDVCPSSRRVRIEHEGVLLAESDRAQWLFEGTFAVVRHYLPREDVAVPLERDDTLRTACAYKGIATYWSVPGVPGMKQIAWSYEDPLPDATAVRGLVCFFTERLDLSVDGVPLPRVRTPWTDPG